MCAFLTPSCVAVLRLECVNCTSGQHIPSFKGNLTSSGPVLAFNSVLEPCFLHLFFEICSLFYIASFPLFKIQAS